MCFDESLYSSPHDPSKTLNPNPTGGATGTSLRHAGSIEMQTLELDGLLVDLLSHGGPWNGKFKLYGYQICKVPKSLKVGHWLNQVEKNQLLLSVCGISSNILSYPPGSDFQSTIAQNLYLASRPVWDGEFTSPIPMANRDLQIGDQQVMTWITWYSVQCTVGKTPSTSSHTEREDLNLNPSFHISWGSGFTGFQIPILTRYDWRILDVQGMCCVFHSLTFQEVVTQHDPRRMPNKVEHGPRADRYKWRYGAPINGRK